MTIEAKKTNPPAWKKLFRNYFVWLAFTAILYILTHAFSALDLISAYRFNVVDMVLTFGFLLFLSLVEAGVFAILLVGLHLGIQRIFHVDPSAVFRLLLLAWFGLGWLNLFLTFFNRSLF